LGAASIEKTLASHATLTKKESEIELRSVRLKQQIEKASTEELNSLYEIHKSLPKNFKYQELETEFQKRLSQ
jgi:hypothetical protein